MVIRMQLRFKDCIEKGLLRKIPASIDNATRSINKAESWLKEAEKSFQGEADTTIDTISGKDFAPRARAWILLTWILLHLTFLSVVDNLKMSGKTVAGCSGCSLP